MSFPWTTLFATRVVAKPTKHDAMLTYPYSREIEFYDHDQFMMKLTLNGLTPECVLAPEPDSRITVADLDESVFPAAAILPDRKPEDTPVVACKLAHIELGEAGA